MRQIPEGEQHGAVDANELGEKLRLVWLRMSGSDPSSKFRNIK